MIVDEKTLMRGQKTHGPLADKEEKNTELRFTGTVLAAKATLQPELTLIKQHDNLEQDCAPQMQELEDEAAAKRTGRMQKTEERLQREMEVAMELLEQEHASALAKRRKELQTDFDRQMREFEDEWDAKLVAMRHVVIV